MLIYRPEFSANKYRKPHIIAIGYIVFAIAVTVYLWRSMLNANKRRDIAEQSLNNDSKEKTVETLEDAEQRRREGDRHVSYRYVI